MSMSARSLAHILDEAPDPTRSYRVTYFGDDKKARHCVLTASVEAVSAKAKELLEVNQLTSISILFPGADFCVLCSMTDTGVITLVRGQPTKII